MSEKDTFGKMRGMAAENGDKSPAKVFDVSEISDEVRAEAAEMVRKAQNDLEPIAQRALKLGGSEEREVIDGLRQILEGMKNATSDLQIERAQVAFYKKVKELEEQMDSGKTIAEVREEAAKRLKEVREEAIKYSDGAKEYLEVLEEQVSGMTKKSEDTVKKTAWRADILDLKRMLTGMAEKVTSEAQFEQSKTAYQNELWDLENQVLAEAGYLLPVRRAERAAFVAAAEERLKTAEKRVKKMEAGERHHLEISLLQLKRRLQDIAVIDAKEELEKAKLDFDEELRAIINLTTMKGEITAKGAEEKEPKVVIDEDYKKEEKAKLAPRVALEDLFKKDILRNKLVAAIDEAIKLVGARKAGRTIDLKRVNELAKELGSDEAARLVQEVPSLKRFVRVVERFPQWASEQNQIEAEEQGEARAKKITDELQAVERVIEIYKGLGPAEQAKALTTLEKKATEFQFELENLGDRVYLGRQILKFIDEVRDLRAQNVERQIWSARKEMSKVERALERGEAAPDLVLLYDYVAEFDNLLNSDALKDRTALLEQMQEFIGRARPTKAKVRELEKRLATQMVAKNAEAQRNKMEMENQQKKRGRLWWAVAGIGAAMGLGTVAYEAAKTERARQEVDELSVKEKARAEETEAKRTVAKESALPVAEALSRATPPAERKVAPGVGAYTLNREPGVGAPAAEQKKPERLSLKAREKILQNWKAQNVDEAVLYQDLGADIKVSPDGSVEVAYSLAPPDAMVALDEESLGAPEITLKRLPYFYRFVAANSFKKEFPLDKVGARSPEEQVWQARVMNVAANLDQLAQNWRHGKKTGIEGVEVPKDLDNVYEIRKKGGVKTIMIHDQRRFKNFLKALMEHAREKIKTPEQGAAERGKVNWDLIYKAIAVDFISPEIEL